LQLADLHGHDHGVRGVGGVELAPDVIQVGDKADVSRALLPAAAQVRTWCSRGVSFFLA
jgi:hypothetical protein